MIGFREFLKESWKRPGGEDVEHEGRVGGQRVKVCFLHRGEARYHIQFATGIPKTLISGHKIVKHVGDRVDQFIRHRKPKSIQMSGDSEKKAELYGQFAKHLVKKHGASHIAWVGGDDHEPDSHEVFFDKGKNK